MDNRARIPLSLILVIFGCSCAPAFAQTQSPSAPHPPRKYYDPNLGIAPTPAPRNSTSSQSPVTSAQKPSGQSTCPGYVLPGDGSGITVAMANAMNAAADAARRNGACAGNNTAVSPHQPTRTLANANSPNSNGRPGYANSFAPGSGVYPPQVGAGANPFTDTTQALDPEAFKAAGSDALTTDMDALINDSGANANNNPAADPGPGDGTNGSISGWLTNPEVRDQFRDTAMDEIWTAAEQIPEFIDNLKNWGGWSAMGNFLSTEVEPTLSGAITDIGGVFVSLEKGLLDPDVASGVKAISDQANDPNKFLNASERSQMCAIMSDTCPVAAASQSAPAPTQPKQP